MSRAQDVSLPSSQRMLGSSACASLGAKALDSCFRRNDEVLRTKLPLSPSGWGVGWGERQRTPTCPATWRWGSLVLTPTYVFEAPEPPAKALLASGFLRFRQLPRVATSGGKVFVSSGYRSMTALDAATGRAVSTPEVSGRGFSDDPDALDEAAQRPEAGDPNAG